MKLIYDVFDKPGRKENILFAFQQMIAIMAATLLVPMIISSYGLPADPAAALFGAGAGSLVYIFFTKRKSPVFLGSSFTFLGCYAASVGAGYGYWGVILGVVIAGLVYVVFAMIIKAVGSAWVNRLMPAVVAGPIVTLIGLSLSGTATSWMMGNGGDGYSLLWILVGLVTFLIIVYCSVKGNKNMKLFPFIYGIGGGYIFALILSLIGNATGAEVLQIMDFSGFKEAFCPFTFASILSIPKFFFLQGIQTQGQYTAVNTSAAIINLLLIYAPIAVVELAQHVGDHKNLSNIIGKDLITDPGLDKTLLGDGIGSAVGALFGGCANTTYGESIGCVAITKNASTYTIATAAYGCLIVAFFTPFVVVINSIPKCVMGGACLALYGLIAVSGLQLLSKVDLGDNRNLFTTSAILVSGIGGLTFNFGHNAATGGALISLTSLAAALVVGLITFKLAGSHVDEAQNEGSAPAGAVGPMKDVDMDK